jgi:hypothetical protein
MENQYSTPTRRDFIKQVGAGLVGLAGLLTAGALASGCATISQRALKEEVGQRQIVNIQPVEQFSKDGCIKQVYCVDYSDGEHIAYTEGDKELPQIVKEYNKKFAKRR